MATSNNDAIKSSRFRILRRLGIGLACIFIAVSMFLFLTEIWLFNTWEALSPDEILFHLQAPLAGTNSSMFFDYIKSYGVVELLIVSAAYLILFLLRKRKPLFHSAMRLFLMLSIGLLGYAFWDFSEQIKLAAFVEPALELEEEEDFIEANYIDPHVVQMVFPEQRRNLIYIFLESMEITFADEPSGGAFAFNAIPELTNLALENECFNGNSGVLNGGISYPGSTWTIGAMFAQSTGTPLKIVGADNAVFSRYDSFFEGLVGLGDILSDQGYRQVLLIGSDVTFGGRRGYYQTHGDFEMRDYYYALENGLIPEGYHVFWGYEDQRLFENAKLTLAELASSWQPFNLTMLTVDTHFEDGYVCELCDNGFEDNQYANVMHCSSRQVIDFVSWIQQQDFYPNTTIVICGDHPTMDSDFCQEVPSTYTRKTYTAVINPAVGVANPTRVREYSTMDLFPTTLAAMGVSIGGERLGLGTNLFSNEDTLTEALGYDVCAEKLEGASTFLADYFTLGNTTAYLDRFRDSVGISVEPVGEGSVRLTLLGINGINYRTIQDVYAVVTNTRTGNSFVRYPMIELRNYQANDFSYSLQLPFSEEELRNYTIDFRLCVDGIEDYGIAFYDGSAIQQREDAEDDSADGTDEFESISESQG